MRILFIFVSVLISPEISAATLNLEEAQTRALESSLEMRSWANSLQAAESAFREANARFLPTFGLKAGSEHKSDEDFERQWFAGAEVRFNLYKGGADQAEVEIARLNHDVTSMSHIQHINEVKYQVAEIFYKYIFHKNLQSYLTQALSLNEAHRKLVERSKAAGQVSQTDVAEFELRDSILRSEILEAKAQLQFLVDSYLQLTNAQEPVVFEAKNLHRHLAESTETLIAEAYKSNADLQRAALQSSKARAEKDLVRSEWLPRLDFEAEVGYLPIEDETQDPHELSSVYRLVATWELFSGGSTRYSHKQKLELLAAAQLLEQAKKHRLTTKIQGIVARLSSLEKLHHLAESRQYNSQTYYQSVKKEYLRGYRNSADLAGASEDLFEAMKNSLRLEIDYLLELAALEPLIGRPARTQIVDEGKK